jgi:hypothetical protein
MIFIFAVSAAQVSENFVAAVAASNSAASCLVVRF